MLTCLPPRYRTSGLPAGDRMRPASRAGRGQGGWLCRGTCGGRQL
jgi:hypothetical protein